MNSTTDPALRSFVPVDAGSDFPIQNLAYGVFRPARGRRRPGVRIGDFVLDLKVLERAGLFRDTVPGAKRVFAGESLNRFMAQGRRAWSAVRARVSELLREDNATLRDHGELRGRALLPIEQVELCLPAVIGDYTDFYSSRQHAYNVGAMFRGPEQALLPNYVWLPVAYHGRASSIVLSGTPVRRPCGQTKAEQDSRPVFGPTRQLDFELEVGFFIGRGNALGEPIRIERAEEHIFGLVLVNDWSARDIQKWEYQPLGPFLSKNFATTISPWIVPLEALEPFRCPGPVHDPEPLPYLRIAKHDAARASSDAGLNVQPSFDIHLEVALATELGPSVQTISRSNFAHLHWTMAQQVAHHTVTGCNLRPGDLLASGTISGPTPDSFGSLLELTWRGERPINLNNGEKRGFLEDGDTVSFRGWCQGDGYRVGFGEATGNILPARS